MKLLVLAGGESGRLRQTLGEGVSRIGLPQLMDWSSRLKLWWIMPFFRRFLCWLTVLGAELCRSVVVVRGGCVSGGYAAGFGHCL